LVAEFSSLRKFFLDKDFALFQIAKDYWRGFGSDCEGLIIVTRLRFGFWSLEVVWILSFVIWSFNLGC
jgi:hypothetical protein